MKQREQWADWLHRPWTAAGRIYCAQFIRGCRNRRRIDQELLGKLFIEGGWASEPEPGPDLVPAMSLMSANKPEGEGR